MQITFEFNPQDKNGTPLAIGDVVEVAPWGERNTIESFDLYVQIDDFAGEVEYCSPKHLSQFIYFKDGGFASPMECNKVEQTVAERIEAVLNDTDLTDGEVLDEILRIVGHERRW